MTKELLSRIELCLSNYCDFCKENNFSHEDADRLDEAEEVLSIVKDMVGKQGGEMSEKVEYKVQWFCYSHHHWINIMYFHELEQARDALVSRQNKIPSERYRIVKDTIIEEVVK